MMILMLLRGGDFFDLIEGGVAILILAGLLVVAAWGVKRILSSRRGERAGSAEEILRERFARGAISAEEYVKAYRVLHETPSHRSYEDYVRDLMDRLRSGRGTVSWLCAHSSEETGCFPRGPRDTSRRKAG